MKIYKESDLKTSETTFCSETTSRHDNMEEMRDDCFHSRVRFWKEEDARLRGPDSQPCTFPSVVIVPAHYPLRHYYHKILPNIDRNVEVPTLTKRKRDVMSD